MNRQLYCINRIPDLTMVKYSAEENGSVEDVLSQQQLFYRQLNKRGLLFGESYRFRVSYLPFENPGRRMHIWLEVIQSKESELSFERQLMASPLPTYYGIQKLETEEEISAEEAASKDQAHTVEERKLIEETYRTIQSANRSLSAMYEKDLRLDDEMPCRAWLVKQSGGIKPYNGHSSDIFYSVDAWQMNDKARLIGLYKFMRVLNQPCQYTVDLIPVSYGKTLRDEFSFQMQWIRTYLNSLDRDHKDDGAEYVLKQCSKFLDSLRSNAHFVCRIGACAGSMATAQMLLDIVASESVEEGGYTIVQEATLEDETAPMGMEKWRTVYTLEEIAPFVALPVLYPGESIEIPKETTPNHRKEKETQYICLGHELLSNDQKGYAVWVKLESLKKHAFLAGVPGSGKTRSMEHIIYQLCLPENNVPFVVLEPAKKEYRAIVGTPEEFMKDITVFSPGGLGSFMLRINPFEFPLGMPLSEHITSLMQVFAGAFDLDGPFPMLLIEGIEEVYRQMDWFPEDINDGKKPYPTMSMLYKQLSVVLENKYAGETKTNLRSVLEVRIGSLLRGDMGNVFDVNRSTLRPEEWLKRRCIVELEALGRDGASFLTLLLCTLIREYLRLHPRDYSRQLRHLIFIEEAHNIIGPSTTPNAENGSAKVAATQFIVDMLAEVRAHQEGIIIADQLPSALAEQVTKNTALKIAHKMTAMDDRQVLGATMSMDGVQLEQMAFFEPGEALCVYDDVKKPFRLKICNCVSEEQVPEQEPDNDKLYDWLSNRECYIQDMKRDWEIMIDKLRNQAAENIKLVKKLAHRFRREEKAALKNAQSQTMPEQNDGCMNLILDELTKQLYFIREDVVKLTNYIGRNRLMHTKFPDDVFRVIDAFFKDWEICMMNLKSYTGIVAAYRDSDKNMIEITINFIQERFDRMNYIVG